MSHTRRRLSQVGAALIVLTLACGDGGTGPQTGSTLQITPASVTLSAGETSQLTATLRDSNGNPLSTSGITWTSSDSRVALVSGTGLVTAQAPGGPVTITAIAGGTSGRASVTVMAGDASQLTMATQPPATAQSGVVLSTQPRVTVLDANSQPVSGEAVTASAPAGISLAGTMTVTSAANGVATFTDLALSGTTGDYTLTFTAGTASVVSDPITLEAGPPSSIVILVQPSSNPQSGTPFAQQPSVEVHDAEGNPVSGVDVVASIASGGGTLGGSTTVQTDAAGQATFTDLSVVGTAGVRTLQFSSGGATALSDPLDVTSGVPGLMSILTQPSSSAENGVALLQQPVIEVTDGGGNPTQGVTVTATVASGGGAVGGTTTAVTDASGVATFVDLSIAGPVGDHTLLFTAGSASIESGTVALSAGAPASVTVVTQPSSTAQYGVTFPQQPSVEVRDAGGNLLNGVDVQASITAGGGSLGGTTTVATGGTGAATFTDLSISGALGAHTLGFTAGSASASSQTIDLVAGPVANLVITLQPSSTAQNAIAFPQQPRVRADDAGGNPVVGISIGATIQSGGGSLGGTVTVSTDGAGEAAFTNLAITGTVGPRTLRFTASAVGVTSAAVNLVAGNPAAVVIVNQPPATATSTLIFTQFPGVQVQDVSGNPVSGQSVVASIATGGGTLYGTKTLSTNGSGTATFADLSITGSPGVRTLRFQSNSLQTTSNNVHLAYAPGTYIDVNYCGLAQQAMDVYVPSGSFARPLPVAAYIHGGGWTSADKSDPGLLLWADVRDELLSRGYIVLTLNYRLGGTAQWPAQINDVKCAIRHMRAKANDYGFDGNRIGVWGASAGGHLASMLGVTDANDSGGSLEGNEGFAAQSSRVKAAVAQGGPSDLTGWPNHTELNFAGPETTFSTWPGPSQELIDASPISWATSDDPPFLIVHGQDDATVLPAQATKLYDALNAAGVGPTLQWVTNADHGLASTGGPVSPTIPQIVQQIADFLDTHVRFNP